MEVIHDIIRESVSGGFWKFIGYWIMIAVIFGLIANVLKIAIVSPFKYLNIKKHGYPPSHCDSMGDLVEEDDEEDNNSSF